MRDRQCALREREIADCAYGECSAVHLYFGPGPIKDQYDEGICLNTSKVHTPPGGGAAVVRNMILNGVHIVETLAPFALTCAAYTEEDIDKTVAAVETSLDRAKAEGEL